MGGVLANGKLCNVETKGLGRDAACSFFFGTNVPRLDGSSSAHLGHIVAVLLLRGSDLPWAPQVGRMAHMAALLQHWKSDSSYAESDS